MRITTKSKYGMRMIVEIAAQPEGKAASVSYTHLDVYKRQMG